MVAAERGLNPFPYGRYVQRVTATWPGGPNASPRFEGERRAGQIPHSDDAPASGQETPRYRADTIVVCRARFRGTNEKSLQHRARSNQFSGPRTGVPPGNYGK